MQELNDIQRKLVEDNHNLIYSYLKKHNLSLNAVEDWYGTAAIGLCKAALYFDENRGRNFSTFAYLVMDNEVKQVIRKNYKCIVDTCSLDSTTNDKEGYLYDIIPDDRDFTTEIYLQDAIDIASKGMSDRDKLIVKLIIEGGYSQAKIAAKLGLSQSHVSRIYNTYMKKIRNYFND